MDGFDEAFLQNGQLQVVARLDGSGSICEFDSYLLRHNFGDTLTRQAEHYHRKVHAQPDHQAGGGGISNPHERMGSKHEITEADLAVDAYRKSMFLDFWKDEAVGEKPIVYRRPTSAKTSLDFCASFNGGKIGKKMTLNKDTLLVQYKFSKLPRGSFKVEINMAMPSCDGPAGRFCVGENTPCGFGQPLGFSGMKEILLEDDVLGGSVYLHSNLACAFASYPHFSVSQSEAGFEKIMQAVTIVMEWPSDALTEDLEIALRVAPTVIDTD